MVASSWVSVEFELSLVFELILILHPPRKIIKNIVQMAKVESLKEWTKVCDPFCWVWGFLLEVIAERKNRDFVIKNNKIEFTESATNGDDKILIQYSYLKDN